MITNFAEEMAGQIVMGKSDDRARYNLYTVDGRVLKIVNNPEEPGLRQESGKFAAEINISPVVDPSKRPPVFSWKGRDEFWPSGLQLQREGQDPVDGAVGQTKQIDEDGTHQRSSYLQGQVK
jgi:hypothetical protein